MRYAKVENGQVTQVDLPTTGILTQAGFEGCNVTAYDKLPYISDRSEIPSLHAEGWRPIVDNPPVYNEETEYLEPTGYSPNETGTEVYANYIVKQREPVIKVPTTEERLAAVEEALLMII